MLTRIELRRPRRKTKAAGPSYSPTLARMIALLQQRAAEESKRREAQAVTQARPAPTTFGHD